MRTLTSTAGERWDAVDVEAALEVARRTAGAVVQRDRRIAHSWWRGERDDEIPDPGVCDIDTYANVLNDRGLAYDKLNLARSKIKDWLVEHPCHHDSFLWFCGKGEFDRLARIEAAVTIERAPPLAIILTVLWVDAHA